VRKELLRRERVPVVWALAKNLMYRMYSRTRRRIRGIRRAA